MTYATPRVQTLTGPRRRFEDALARCRRMYESGAEDVRWATANRYPALHVPDGFPRGDTASWLLGALHQRRDMVRMRGGAERSRSVGQLRHRRALRDGTPDDT